MLSFIHDSHNTKGSGGYRSIYFTVGLAFITVRVLKKTYFLFRSELSDWAAA